MRTLILTGCFLALTAAHADAQCLGDFNGDGTVSIDELITAVNNSLNNCQLSGPRFVDNGDGTVTDHNTGLQWEKKDQSGGIHDWSKTYTWCGASCYNTNIMDGTITSTFLAGLNAGSGFAGHTDWRIPKMNELQSLANYENVGPAVDPAFNTACAASCTVTSCSCTGQSFEYWSSTTYHGNSIGAWVVFFGDGTVLSSSKDGIDYARAVRNAS
jgi:hypothetical protein